MVFRIAVNHTMTLMRRYIRNMGRKPSEIYFNLDQLCQAIGYDPTNVAERTKAYQVLTYWRRKGLEYWQELANEGKINMQGFAVQWDIFIHNYNNIHSCYFFLYDRDDGSYYQPSFSEKETLSQRRIKKHADAMVTVLSEMAKFNERLLITGRPIREALQEAEQYKQKYITDGSYR